MDVVVVGYLSIDEINGPAGRFSNVPGGAAYYCAASAAVAGASVGLVSRIGHDFPDAALAALVELGVTLGVERAEVPSPRSNLSDPSGRDRVASHHRDPIWWEAQRQLTPPKPPFKAAVHVFNAMPAASLEAQIAYAEGSLRIADTGTSFVSAEGDALRALVPRLDVFAPSREETRLLYPELTDDEALAFIASQTSLAVQKRGPDGLFLKRGSGPTLNEPTRVKELVDSTGAGDSVVGALAAGLARGLSDRELLERASELAALMVSGVGIAGLQRAAAARTRLRS